MGSSTSVEAFNYDEQLMAAGGNYTFEIDEKVPDGCSKIRRGQNAKDGLLTYDNENIRTVWAAFQDAVSKFSERQMFGTREFVMDEEKKTLSKIKGEYVRGPFRWLTYGQVDERVKALSSGLLTLPLANGGRLGKNDNVGIYANNRSEWLITALAAYSQTMRGVALYATLGDEAIQYITNHAELKIVFTSKEHISHLKKVVDELKTVEYIVQFDASPDYGNIEETVDAADQSFFESKGKHLIGFTGLLQQGREANNPVNAPTSEDLAFIMYTSGTTGNPKGVMLSHANLIAPSSHTNLVIPMDSEERYLSYLPLAHIFESVIQLALWKNGVKIGFFQGSVKRLTDDFTAIEPTIVCGVPRVFQRMYQKVFDGVSGKGCIPRSVFYRAYNTQVEAIRRGERDSYWDQKIFRSVRERVGFGSLKTIVSGGAPLPPYLAEFLKVCMVCNVVQGYGLTETAAGLSIQSMNDHTLGHVGGLWHWAEVMLKSVPDMGYDATGAVPKGEVLVRGAGVFKGYYRDPDATTGAFDGEWFATGDIGRWNPNGTLSIIDRKKNIFKLAQGEYVAAEKIEACYQQSASINQIFVYGNSYKNDLVAVVVPNAEWAIKTGNDRKFINCTAPVGSQEFIDAFATLFTGANAQEMRALFEAEFRRNEGELKGFEKVKSFHIESRIDALMQGFSIENECLTPTFKLRRPQLLRKYLDEIKQMYTAMGDPPKAEERWV